jgi:hypothetical protein
MEIVVATTIFATVLTMMLVLFNYTLQINRRVDALRQSAQSTRNFMEFLVREIRNGKIDYVTSYNNCQPDYFSQKNGSLAIVNRAGELECFYANGNNLFIEKAGINSQINPVNLSINTSTFRFIVRPSADAHPADPPFPGIQPFVTIMAEFTTTVPGVDKPVIIPYETTVSPDIYDIPHQQ